ncbi:MAG: hypothetical protein Q7T61_17715 [Caulobacter sp.]|nr:hypothetical protein [Caulobacter sp.]
MLIYEGSYTHYGMEIVWHATASGETYEVRLDVHGKPPIRLGKRWTFHQVGFWSLHDPDDQVEIAGVRIRFPSDLEVVPPKKSVAEYSDDEWLFKELYERRLIMAGVQSDIERENAHWAGIVDKQRESQKQDYESSSRYSNLIVGLGYGAFFAIWASMSGKIATPILLWSAGFLSVSLILFVMHEITSMAVRAVYIWDVGSWFSADKHWRTQAENHRHRQRRADAGNAFLAKSWVWFFVPTLLFGFAGAATLGAASLLTAIHGLPR